MTAVFVWPTVDTGAVEEYRDATGVDYDDTGYLVVVTGEPDASPAAVWAPGQWQRAEVRADR